MACTFDSVTVTADDPSLATANLKTSEQSYHTLCAANDHSLAEPLPAAGNRHQQYGQHHFQQGEYGFVVFLPKLNKVFWDHHAAALHGETERSNHAKAYKARKRMSEFSLRQFMQWYMPCQRDLFSQSLFTDDSYQGFQLDLCVAHNHQHLRYLCIPLHYQQQTVWASFVRATVAKQDKALIDLALRKARQLLTELV